MVLDYSAPLLVPAAGLRKEMVRLSLASVVLATNPVEVTCKALVRHGAYMAALSRCRASDRTHVLVSCKSILALDARPVWLRRGVTSVAHYLVHETRSLEAT
jgi:hypothetical protein